MQRMITEQTHELEEMQSEFSNASNLMNEKYSQLNNRFIELQDIYE